MLKTKSDVVFEPSYASRNSQIEKFQTNQYKTQNENHEFQ